MQGQDTPSERVADLDELDLGPGCGVPGHIRDERDYEVGGDEGYSGGRFVALAHESRREAACDELIEQSPLPVPFPGNDKGLLAQFFDPHRFLPGEAVTGQHRQPHRFVVQIEADEALIVDGLGGHAQVDLPCVQGPVHVVSWHLVEFDLDLRVGTPEGGERTGQGQEGLGAQAHAADVGLGDGASPLGEFTQGPLDVPAEDAALVVEPQSAGPVEQGCAQLGFQARDGPAQRRLRHVKLGCRPAEVLDPCDDEELLERMQIHVRTSLLIASKA